MDFFENRYYRVPRRLLILIGQWPYSGSKAKTISRIFICSFQITCMGAQLAKLVIESCDFYKFLEYMPLVIYSIIIGLKYLTCWINNKEMQDLLERVKSDWQSLKSKGELEVLHKYTEEGRVFIKFYSLTAFVALCAYIMLLSTGPVLDIVMPLNESTKRPLLIEYEYFVDSQKYFYPILLHIEINFVITMTILAAADAMYFLIFFHGCGMFAVIAYRLKHAFSDVENIARKDQDSVFCARLARTVRYQYSLNEYLRIAMNCYTNFYAVQLVIVALEIIGTLLNIQKSLVLSESIEVFSYIVDISVYYVFLFLNIFPYQKMTTCSSYIFREAYQGQWYEGAVRPRKLLHFLMLKSQQPFVVTIAGFVVMSSETFIWIVQTTASYFTVLYSLRQV